MGNSCHKSKKKVTLVMVGLDNSGKTTAAKGLIGESPEDVAPTFGFSSHELRRNNFDVTLYDLGGSRSIRGIWRNYLAESFGFVFVVDASDHERSVESRDVLHDLLRHPNVSGKPFLILANKQDLDGAMDDVELVGLLEVEPLANETKCRTRVEICSALYGESSLKKPDRHIQSGFKWLLTTIGLDYDALRDRVEKDVAIQRQNEAAQLRERNERVAKLRRERSTLDDAALSTSEKEPKPDEMRDFMNSADPFKPISTIVKKLEEHNRISPDVNTTESNLPANTFESPPISPTARVIRVASADVEDDLEETFQTNENSGLVKYDASSEAGVDVVENEIPRAGTSPSKERSFDDIAKDDLDVLCLPLSPSKAAVSIIGTDNQVIELEKSTKTRKRRIFSRNNKTSPSPTNNLIVSTPLAPLILKTGQQRAIESLDTQHTTANGFIKLSWGLAEELEIIESNRLPQVS